MITTGRTPFKIIPTDKVFTYYRVKRIDRFINNKRHSTEISIGGVFERINFLYTSILLLTRDRKHQIHSFFLRSNFIHYIFFISRNNWQVAT